MLEKVVEKVDSYFSAGHDALLESGWNRIKKELAELSKTPTNNESLAIALMNKLLNSFENESNTLFKLEILNCMAEWERSAKADIS